jgi:hypothetical protein
MFTIFITHTSFQLYHCHFPSSYLESIHLHPPASSPNPHDLETASAPGVTLRSTRLYDFCDVDHRGEWLDILVALIEYLRSGESKVGFLNKSLEKNMLHKSVEDAHVEETDVDVEETDAVGEGVGVTRAEMGRVEAEVEGSGLRRSERKRRLEKRDEDEEGRQEGEEKGERDRKVRGRRRRRV